MMFPETQRQVEQKLEHVYGFKRKPSTNGDKLRGRCPDCNHKESSAWAFAEEPWIVFCPRKNECGHENHVRDLFLNFLKSGKNALNRHLKILYVLLTRI